MSSAVRRQPRRRQLAVPQHVLPRLVPARVPGEVPGYPLAARGAHVEAARRAVLSGDADLIIATQPVDANAFSFAELYSEEMVLVLPAGHELSKQYHLPQDCRGTLPLLPIGS